MKQKNRKIVTGSYFDNFCHWTLIIFIMILLCGCEQALFTDRPEEEINEMMSTLISNDIPCTKSSGSEGTFSISVGSGNIAKAVQLLKNMGLPREHHANVGEIFRKKGLISSPAEERIRYVFALSQEVSGTIAQIDGVLASRVHIVLPENDPFGDRTLPSSASVFIKYKKNYDIEGQAIKIKELVVNSIEGLEFKNVTVALFKSQADVAREMPVNFVSMFGFRMAPDSAQMFRWVAALTISLGVGCVLGFGYIIYRKGIPFFNKGRSHALVNMKP